MKRYAIWAAATPLILAGVGCNDLLAVKNENNADIPRLLAKPSDVEALASSQYQQIIDGSYGAGSTARVEIGLLTAAFENSSGLANNGLGPRSNMPRQSIGNERGNVYATENFADFRIFTGVARTSSTVLQMAEAPGFSLNRTPGDEQRLRAWAHFTRGVALGDLALVYDSAGIPRPTDPAFRSPPFYVPPLEGYQAVMTEALRSLDSAITYAQMQGTVPIGAGWLRGPDGPAVPVDTFVQLVKSYRARFRAGVARTPAERGQVDWALVVADAQAGIKRDFIVTMKAASGWEFNWLNTTLHYRDTNWHQMTNYIIGMADTSRAFDTWLSQPRDNKVPFLILTPDKRFPAGATRSAQNAVGQGAPTGRRYFRNRAPGLDQAGNGWRNSQYDFYRFRAYADAARNGDFPIFTVAENDMLAAEGLLRQGGAANVAAAAALIDKTRVTAGLAALTGAVTAATDSVPGGTACVPRVPVGPTFTTTACGSVFEAMKWEKRMETAYTTYGAWFFDSRGWGDLPIGTALSWPVPYQELDARRKPIYDIGGVGQPGSAGQSTYGYGSTINGTPL